MNTTYSLELNVKEQLGCKDESDFMNTLKDVARGGANSGFSGFCYSSEMLDFYKANREDIVQLLKDSAFDFGTTVIQLIQGFNCLKDNDTTEDDIASVVFGKDYEHEMSHIIIDAVCWFVLETLAFNYEA